MKSAWLSLTPSELIRTKISATCSSFAPTPSSTTWNRKSPQVAHPVHPFLEDVLVGAAQARHLGSRPAVQELAHRGLVAVHPQRGDVGDELGVTLDRCVGDLERLVFGAEGRCGSAFLEGLREHRPPGEHGEQRCKPLLTVDDQELRDALACPQPTWRVPTSAPVSQNIIVPIG